MLLLKVLLKVFAERHPDQLASMNTQNRQPAYAYSNTFARARPLMIYMLTVGHALPSSAPAASSSAAVAHPAKRRRPRLLACEASASRN